MQGKTDFMVVNLSMTALSVCEMYGKDCSLND